MTNDDNDKPQWQHIADLTSKIVMAYLEKANPPVPVEDLPKLIGRVREELTGRPSQAKNLGQLEDEMRKVARGEIAPPQTGAWTKREDTSGKFVDVVAATDTFDGKREPNGHHPEPKPPQKPAVPIENSVTPHHIFCLEDGCRMRILKGHLMAKHNMTPDEYRAKWGLPKDYPMTAPTYSEKRKQIAAGLGLGKYIARGRKKAREAVR